MSRQDFGGRECRRMTQGKPDLSARVVSRSVARSAIWTTSGITAAHRTRKADCPGGSTALDVPLSRPSAAGLSPSLAGRATAKLRSREHTGRPAGTIQSAPTPPWNRVGSEGHIAGARTSETPPGPGSSKTETAGSPDRVDRKTSLPATGKNRGIDL